MTGPLRIERRLLYGVPDHSNRSYEPSTVLACRSRRTRSRLITIQTHVARTRLPSWEGWFTFQPSVSAVDGDDSVRLDRREAPWPPATSSWVVVTSTRTRTRVPSLSSLSTTTFCQSRPHTLALGDTSVVPKHIQGGGRPSPSVITQPPLLF